MLQLLQHTPNLALREAMVTGLETSGSDEGGDLRITGVRTYFGSSCSIWRAYWRLSVWARRAHTAGPRLALSTRFCRAVASAKRPITPPRASTSCTSWLLAGPPTAGLQGCQAMRSRLRLNRAVEMPSRAAVSAASQPA